MIKRIQQDSGARVQFIQGKEDVPGDKLCQITGAMDQVQKASALIRELIQSVMVILSLKIRVIVNILLDIVYYSN